MEKAIKTSKSFRSFLIDKTEFLKEEEESNKKVLALKYRPQVFEELVGQNIIVEAIQKELDNFKDSFGKEWKAWELSDLKYRLENNWTFYLYNSLQQRKVCLLLNHHQHIGPFLKHLVIQPIQMHPRKQLNTKD